MRPNVIFTKLNAELFQFLAKSLPNRTSRFDAFQYFMNVIRDMRLRVDPEAKDGESATLPKPEAVTIDKIDE